MIYCRGDHWVAPIHNHTMPSKFDPSKHHRRSIRVPGYDYSQPGAYFITKVSRFDRDLAHFLAGQKNKIYLPKYDRLTDDEKLELYMKIEPDLSIDDSARSKVELEKEKTENERLRKQEIAQEKRIKALENWAEKMQSN